MYRQLLENSPLLTFPLIALFLFLAVFVSVVVRTFARRAEAYDAQASLPLAHDDRPPVPPLSRAHTGEEG